MSRLLFALIASLVISFNYCSAQTTDSDPSRSPESCGVGWNPSSSPCALEVSPLNFTPSTMLSKSTGDFRYQAYLITQPARTLLVKFSAPSNNSNPTLIMDMSGFWNATTEPLSLSTRLCDVNGDNCTAYETAAINSTTHVYSANLNNTVPGGAYHPFAFAFIQFQDVPGQNNTNWTIGGDGGPQDLSPNPAWEALFNNPEPYSGVVLSMSIQ